MENERHGIHIDIYKMRKSAADEKILSYNDAVLRRSDLDILSGPYFLNYRIIEFYFSYLPSCYPSEEFVLVSPSIAFWIANCPDIESFKDFVEPLNLSSKKLVIFPVNNNDDVTEAEGGNRWSLHANVSVLHDSYGGLNAGLAKQLYRAIVGYMGISDMASACKYVVCSKTPQQVNGYNCGLYVATIVNPSVVDKMRTVILRLVKSLMSMNYRDSGIEEKRGMDPLYKSVMFSMGNCHWNREHSHPFHRGVGMVEL
ncbi:hypothetical protein HYC85_031801 [Camellia sinensis]|uniref:Ubiquitin-like protease family profile domain-containing protein n=1 Tax=Camellia sinensis TaxID=4442 RepID=A0A7J7FTB5_CAMSI|nr:hypothetical protein HYC85_031801 [Camellia sinensis]